MATPTVTIRVPAETRDRLAARAAERGTSLAALLGEIAAEQERAALLESERRATYADARAGAGLDPVWDETLADGLD